MSLAQISTGSIILSVLLAIINYIILIGYDWLALKCIHKTLPVSRVSLVSFVGQAVSYNFGALLGGSTVRFRFYSSWGFSPMDIVRLVLMLAITFWVGALGLVGAIFMLAPPAIPPELGMHMPLDIRPLGAILFLIAISYLIVCKFIHKPIHIFGCLLYTSHLRDAHKAIETGNQVEGLHMRQKDGVALAMGQAVEAAKLMRHRVHVPQTGVVEGHPGKILGVGHAFTGFHVLAVGHGLAQVLGNQTDGLFRAGVRHRRGVGGNVRFDGCLLYTSPWGTAT